MSTLAVREFSRTGGTDGIERTGPDVPVERVAVGDYTLSLARAHLVVLIVLTLAIALTLPLYSRFWGSTAEDLSAALLQYDVLTTVAVVFASVVVHELLHAIGFRTSGQIPWRDIKFGVKWSSMTPYATTQAIMPAWAYRQAALLPAWVLGVFPILLGLALGNELLGAYGIFMLAGAGGDIAAVWGMRGVHVDATVRDSLSRVGCEVLIERRVAASPVAVDRRLRRVAA